MDGILPMPTGEQPVPDGEFPFLLGRVLERATGMTAILGPDAIPAGVQLATSMGG